MLKARTALGAGLAVVAIALALVLSSSPPAVTRSGAPVISSYNLGRSKEPSRICQAGEVLPRDTSAIRVWLEAVIGPRVEVQAISHGRVIARGTRGPGWTSGSVTVPISPRPRQASPVTVCTSFAKPSEPVGPVGVSTGAKVAATDRQGPLGHAGKDRAASYREGPMSGRVVIEYLQPGKRSWWSLARTVARHMGLGHAGSGPLIPLLALALMLALAGVTTGLVLRELA
jgi:hypothetical protein